VCVLTFASAMTPRVHRYVRTPGGWTWSQCLHEVEPGSHVIDLGEDGMRIEHPDHAPRHIMQCPRKAFLSNAEKKALDMQQNAPHRRELVMRETAAAMNGWQAWVAYNNVGNLTFDTFLGYFNVPAAPKNFPGAKIGILYMFTGLQNDNWIPDYSKFDPPESFDIIQPVLQYGGGSENGGGLYWSLASWYVAISAGTVYSKAQKVNAGDNLFGNMTRLSSTSWYIAGVTSGGVSTDITVTRNRLVSQSWAYCTLEIYDITSCTQLPAAPATQSYTQLSLTANGQTITPSWTTLSQPNQQCGTSMSVVNASTVILTFQK